MYQCPSCGAGLRFDIRSQRLMCDFCGSIFDPETFEDGSGAEESEEFGVTIFTCRSCGAELVSTDASATGFCSYCGASTVLEARLGTEKRPKLITPFKKTKEDCKAAYTEVLNKAWYAPKELRDPEFLEKFRGIYMPYWLYRIHFNPMVTLEGERKRTSGNYTTTDELAISCQLTGTYENIPYDASSSFDDDIAATIAPFNAKEMKPFKTAYLAGFYADTADVDRAVYRQDAIDRGGEYAMKSIKAGLEESNITLSSPDSKSGVEQLLGTKCDYPEGAFLPVWFLTWRKKDRVAYAIVNGETGKVSADIPVDLKRYFLGTMMVAAVLFLISNLLISMTAPTALGLSALLGAVAAGLFYVEMRSIMRKENHLDDKGFFERSGSSRSKTLLMEDTKKKREGVKKSPLKGKLEGMLSYWIVFIVLIISEGLLTRLFEVVSSLASAGRYIFTVAALAFGIFYFVRSMAILKDVREKSMAVPAVTSLIGILAAAAVNFANPFEDWFYYAASIFCLIGVLVTCIELIRRHNLLATRPVPDFFDRKGGNDKAERDGRTDDYSSPEPPKPFDRFVQKGKKAADQSKKGMRNIDRIMALLLACAVAGGILSGSALRTSASAGGVSPASALFSSNEENGYCIYLKDDADLLTDEEEQMLLSDMAPVTEYGGAAFVSGYYYGQDTSDAAKDAYRQYFGKNSGTLFMIDMGNRNIYIFSDGAIYRVITKPYANTITDNIYRYATRGEYYTCAKEAFSQIKTLLDGGRISQPMKYITNALTALILSLLINYAMMKRTAKIAKPTAAAILGAMTVGFHTGSRQTRVMRSVRRYTGSSSSHGGGGGGGFSGGGGGGGSSGGGGGHGF